MTPLIPITSPAFRYVPAVKTDIRMLFLRVRAAQQLKPWSKVNP